MATTWSASARPNSIFNPFFGKSNPIGLKSTVTQRVAAENNPAFFYLFNFLVCVHTLKTTTNTSGLKTVSLNTTGLHTKCTIYSSLYSEVQPLVGFFALLRDGLVSLNKWRETVGPHTYTHNMSKRCINIHRLLVYASVSVQVYTYVYQHNIALFLSHRLHFS